MDLKKISFLALVLIALSQAEPEPDPEAQAEAEPQADPQNYGTGPILAPQPPIYGRPDYGGGQPDFGGGRPDYGGGQPDYGQPPFGYPPVYDNPDPGFGRPDMGLYPGGGSNKPDYNPSGKPDYNPGGNTCGLTDQCCGMDKENCCLNNRPGAPQQSYTVWERQCDTDSQLQCPVSVMKKCYPIRVPNCRLVTDVVSRTFKSKKCIPKPMRKCFDIQVQQCKMGSREVVEEIPYKNQELQKTGTDSKEYCYDFPTKDCTNTTQTITQRYPVQKIKTINETRQQCQMVQKRQPSRQITVTVTRPQYKQMCYDMPVPKCSQTPCQQAGQCSSGTSACSNQQFNTATVCPQAQPGQPKPPYASGGCQQVQQPACNMGPQPQTCGQDYQQCCRTETRKVCRTVMQRVPQQVQQTIPGGVSWVQDCRPVTYQRTVPYTEWETRTIEKPKYNCRDVTKKECHTLTQDEYDVTTVDVKGNVTINLPTCEPETKTINKCISIPDGQVECINDTVEKYIKITSQVCDGEKVIQKCFKNAVAQCYQSQVPNCRMVPREVKVPTCSQSNLCNTCNSFIQNPQQGFGSCPSSSCPNYIDGGDEIQAVGNTTVIGGNIPGSGSYYPYGQQTGFLVEDSLSDVMN